MKAPSTDTTKGRKIHGVATRLSWFGIEAVIFAADKRTLKRVVECAPGWKFDPKKAKKVFIEGKE